MVGAVVTAKAVQHRRGLELVLVCAREGGREGERGGRIEEQKEVKYRHG